MLLWPTISIPYSIVPNPGVCMSYSQPYHSRALLLLPPLLFNFLFFVVSVLRFCCCFGTSVIINRFYYRLTSENDQNPNLYHFCLGMMALREQERSLASSGLRFCWASFLQNVQRCMFYLFIFYLDYNL